MWIGTESEYKLTLGTVKMKILILIIRLHLTQIHA